MIIEQQNCPGYYYFNLLPCHIFTSFYFPRNNTINCLANIMSKSNISLTAQFIHIKIPYSLHHQWVTCLYWHLSNGMFCSTMNATSTRLMNAFQIIAFPGIHFWFFTFHHHQSLQTHSAQHIFTQTLTLGKTLTF